MYFYKRLGFTRFESLLGLAVIAAVLLVALPPLRGSLVRERPLRAVVGAEILARAVVDYHTDTGAWPLAADGLVELSRLTGPAAAADGGAGLMGTLVDGAGAAAIRPWLTEVPLDPWNRPYRVAVIEPWSPLDDAAAGGESPQIYPDAPPAGTVIVVVSAGPDGIANTDPWALDPSQVLAGADAANRALATHFGGDDVGFILTRPAGGGGR